MATIISRLVGFMWAASLPVHAIALHAPRPNVIIVLTDDQGYKDLKVVLHGAEEHPKVARRMMKFIEFAHEYHGDGSRGILGAGER